jgi:hypothetical protein
LDWVGLGGGRHVLEAEQNLTACASCHAESDCAACHRTENPHGEEFFDRCGALRDANPGLCQRCHVDAAALDGCR